MRLSRRSWQILALMLLLVAFVWGSCGLLFAATPTEPSENVPDPDSTGFQMSRGCCLSPAFSLVFLAYLAFMVSRRRDPKAIWGELLAALLAACGLLLILGGLGGIIKPGQDPAMTRTMFAGVCVLPGFFIVGLASILWLFVVRPKQTL